MQDSPVEGRLTLRSCCIPLEIDPVVASDIRCPLPVFVASYMSTSDTLQMRIIPAYSQLRRGYAAVVPAVVLRTLLHTLLLWMREVLQQQGEETSI